jgi:chromosome segregation ATPase
MHMPIQKQIQDIYGYHQPILFFKEHPNIAYEMCMRTEEKLTMAYVILRQSMDSMTKHAEDMNNNYKSQLESKDCALQAKDCALQAKDCALQAKDTALQARDGTLQAKDDALQAKDAVIKTKDECMEKLRDKYDAEQSELKSQLARANNEILKLAHSLSVRGMIEKIEFQYSDRRRKEGSLASRKAVWTEILDENERIRQAVTSTCTGRNTACKVSMAVETIAEIYRRDDIHNATVRERRDVYRSTGSQY